MYAVMLIILGRGRYVGLFAIVFACLSCGLSFPDRDVSQNEYFPLDVGEVWTYRLVSPAQPLPHPKEIATRVLGVERTQNQTYLLVKNLFPHKSSSPDTAMTFLLRKEGTMIFLFIKGREDLRYNAGMGDVPFHQDREFLLYDFSDLERKKAWTVPLFVNPALLYNYSVERTRGEVDSSEVHFRFSLGRELWWEETFSRGIGRTKVILSSQVFGLIRWQLEGVDDGFPSLP